QQRVHAQISNQEAAYEPCAESDRYRRQDGHDEPVSGGQIGGGGGEVGNRTDRNVNATRYHDKSESRGRGQKEARGDADLGPVANGEERMGYDAKERDKRNQQGIESIIEGC